MTHTIESAVTIDKSHFSTSEKNTQKLPYQTNNDNKTQ